VRRSLHPGIQMGLAAALFFLIAYPIALLIHMPAALIQVPMTAILFGVFYTLFVRFYMERYEGSGRTSVTQARVPGERWTQHDLVGGGIASPADSKLSAIPVD
jgi:hypothetical protein